MTETTKRRIKDRFTDGIRWEEFLRALTSQQNLQVTLERFGPAQALFKSMTFTGYTNRWRVTGHLTKPEVGARLGGSTFFSGEINRATEACEIDYEVSD